MKNIIEDYREIVKEGCGRCATVWFLLRIEMLRLRLFIGRQFFKIKARRRAKKWMREYMAYSRILREGPGDEP